MKKLSKLICNTVSVRSLTLGLLLLLPFISSGAPLRGTWWWTSAGHPWGVDQVIGNPVKENELLQFLKDWSFKKVYCSFSSTTRANPAVIRAWNTKLDESGILSQFLLSENTWIFTQYRPDLLASIQANLIDFNAAATNDSQRYDALHLDIEPHGLPDWASNRKTYLWLLRDTFADVRAYLDNNGAADIPVYADIPVWYDNPANPWDTTAERDAWFTAIEQSLAGISLMAYERDTDSKIEAGISWELQNFAGETRVGLEAVVGAGQTWNSFNELLSMIQTQEAKVSLPRQVDVHHLVKFHDVAPSPAFADVSLFDDAVELSWFATNGALFQLQYSPDLINWVDFGDVVTGCNSNIYVLVSGRTNSNRVYRVKITE